MGDRSPVAASVPRNLAQEMESATLTLATDNTELRDLLNAYATQAAEGAYRSLEFEEAARFYAMAAAALERVAGRSAQRCELLLRRGAALWNAGGFEEAEAAFWEAARSREAQPSSGPAEARTFEPPDRYDAAARRHVTLLEKALRQPVARDRTARIRQVGQLVADSIPLLPEEDVTLRARLLALLAAEARTLPARAPDEPSAGFEVLHPAIEAAREAGRKVLSLPVNGPSQREIPASPISHENGATHAVTPVLAQTVCLAHGEMEPAREPLLTASRYQNGHTNGGADVPTAPAVLPTPLVARRPSDAGISLAGAENGLTHREIEVLKLLAAGRTSREISQDLILSIRTVGTHITNIYSKIGARGRADATTYALRHAITSE